MSAIKITGNNGGSVQIQTGHIAQDMAAATKKAVNVVVDYVKENGPKITVTSSPAPVIETVAPDMNLDV